MNKLRSSVAAAADAAAGASADAGGGIDWESAAGEIDFDALYKKKQEEKAIVDEFGAFSAAVFFLQLAQ